VYIQRNWKQDIWDFPAPIEGIPEIIVMYQLFGATWKILW